jgi:hypothetical protein
VNGAIPGHFALELLRYRDHFAQDGVTRLTNAFSKKLENLQAAVALHFAYYNFARVHQTLRVRQQWKLASRITFGRLRTSSGSLTELQSASSRLPATTRAAI